MRARNLSVIVVTVDGNRWSFNEASVSLGSTVLVVKTEMATVTFILSNVVWYKTADGCTETEPECYTREE